MRRKEKIIKSNGPEMLYSKNKPSYNVYYLEDEIKINFYF
jgi:hypothetical protein